MQSDSCVTDAPGSWQTALQAAKFGKVVLPPGPDVVVLDDVVVGTVSGVVEGTVLLVEVLVVVGRVLDVVVVEVVVVVVGQHIPLLPTSEAIALPTKWPRRLFP